MENTINPNIFYWIDILGSAKVVFGSVAVIASIIALLMIGDTSISYKTKKITFIVSFVLIVLSLLTPSSLTLYQMLVCKSLDDKNKLKLLKNITDIAVILKN